MSKHRFLTSCTICFSFFFAAGTPLAIAEENYPSKSITIVTPYPTGGTSDAVMLPFNAAFSEVMKQTIIYEHKPGAFTNIGNEYVARSNPDGYTIFLGNITLAQNKWFGPYLPADVREGLIPVSKIMDIGGVVSAKKDFRASSWPEIIEVAKTSNKNLSIGSAQADVIIAQMVEASGIKLLSIPYKGGGLVLTDLLGGHIDMMWGFLPAQYQQIKAESIKPIAVSSSKRLPQLPDTPTLKEIGVDYSIDAWYGFFVPVGTNPKIVEKIAVATKKVLAMPHIIEAFRNAGAEPIATTPQEFLEITQRDDKRFEEQAKKFPTLVQKKAN